MSKKRFLRRIWGLISAIFIAWLFVTPVLSQEIAVGLGIIVEGNTEGESAAGLYNPLLCQSLACSRINSLLFPTLLGIDHATTQFVGSNGEDYVLARDWEIAEDGISYTLNLRNDIFWSDGTPITAYDVLFTYLALVSEDIDSFYAGPVSENVATVRFIDEHSIAFTFKTRTCDALHALNIPILPAHAFEADFVEFVDTAFDNTETPSENLWIPDLLADFRFSYLTNHSFNYAPTATAGVFQLDEQRYAEYVRLVSSDSSQGFAFVNVADTNTEVALFMNGDLNFIDNPLYHHWDTILNADHIQAFEYPGLTWDSITFNLADPANPQNAYDENGDPIEQGVHPLFGDLQVRRAIQLGINVPDLVEAALLGHGTIMPANQPPTSWAFNNDLPPVEYNPVEAARLLESAGWKDVNRDGIRECISCLYAPEDTRLSFTLIYPENSVYSISALLIRQQLRQIGIEVRGTVTDSNALTSIIREQSYDAYLSGRTETYPPSPDQTQRFTSIGDVLETGLNTGSYSNPRVDELMEKALTLPDCDSARRAEIYREIQTLIQADQPYIWLFARNELVATRDTVKGFAPYPNAPLWNIRDWVIMR